MKKNRILTVLCLMLVAAVSVMSTLAYLTDTDSAVNTFTVGQVDITLDEAKVDKDGKWILDEEGNPVERVKGNEYRLIPDQTYIKDPTITIKADSEMSYIRMAVTIDCMKELDAVFAPEGADLTEIFGGYDPELWIFAGQTQDEKANTITYEFRYRETVAGGTEDTTLEPLFESFTVPGTITGEELKTLQGLSITVNGHAIQAAGFSDEAAAWKAFDEQIAANS